MHAKVKSHACMIMHTHACFHMLSSALAALPYRLLCLQLQYAARRGFYFSTSKPGTATKEGPKVPPLPRDFMQVEGLRSRSSVTCTTHKLNALNARLQDAATDCLVLTEQVCHWSGMRGTPSSLTQVMLITQGALRREQSLG